MADTSVHTFTKGLVLERDFERARGLSALKLGSENDLPGND